MKDKGSIPRGLQIFSRYADAHFINEMLKPSLKIIVVNIFSALLMFASNYLLIQLLGEKGYGQYVIINVWLSILAVLCLFGLDDYFIAVLPKYAQEVSARNIYTTILKRSLKVFLIAYLVVLILFLLLSYLFPANEIIVRHQVFFIALLPLLALLLLLTSFLRGLNKPVIGQTVDKIVRPGLFFAGIALLFFTREMGTIDEVLIIQTVSISFGILMLFFFIRKRISFPSQPIGLKLNGSTTSTYLFISLLYLLSTRLDILFLERHVLPEEVGYYNLAARLSDLVAFPLTAFNLLMPLLLSKTFHHQPANLQKNIKSILMVAVGITLLAFTVLLFIGRPLLQVFGTKFVMAYWPLLILCGSQVFAAFAAPFNALLMISGKQRYSLVSLAGFVITTFILCSILIPVYGGIGAAFAIMFGQVSYMSGVYFFSKSKVMKQV
jgi:O-antigen/teichoic acid export membrane protein